MGIWAVKTAKSAGVPEFDPVQVMLHLEHVLESAAFRSSHRSCQFLRFVVETFLSGQPDQLKERQIGEKVFGRLPDYDTGQDSIVRVKANEVRRRLSQYYELHPGARLRIELPAGSYVPLIHAGAAPVQLTADALAAPTRSPMPRWPIALSAACALLVFSSLLLNRASASATQFSVFWAPFLKGSHEVMLCLPTPEVYRIYGEHRADLVEHFKPRAPGEPMPQLAAERLVGVRIVPEQGMALGLGDAHAMTQLFSFVSASGRAPQIRLGRETTFTELRAGPNILIGAFTNQWTLDLMNDTRYAFESRDSGYGIVDRSTGRLLCRKPNSWEPRGSEDCAIITRIVQSKTGHPLLVAAGLDHFGTYAAGEFLTHPDVLEAALRQSPADWANRNLQIVFRIEVLRDNIGPPKVLARHVW